ncbi:MAG: transporter [Pseudomonadota bacterium]
MFRYLPVLVAGAAVFATQVHACDYCLIGQGISPLQTQTGAGVRVAQRYTLLDSIYAGDSELGNPGVTEEYWTTEVSGFYSVSERLLVLATLPLRQTRGNGELAIGPGGDPEREDITGDARGIGDLSLLGRYTFHTRHTLDSTTLLAGVLGIKLPTGSTRRHGDQDEFLDAHLQPGTGSTDLLFGVSVDHAQGRLALSANLLASIPGKGETGDLSHQFGHSLNYDVTGKYRLTPAASGSGANALFVALGVNGEVRGKEKLDGVTLDDTGGHTIYLTPGLQYQVAQHWIFEFTYQHAVYHDVNEIQLGEDYKLFGAATYLF